MRIPIARFTARNQVIMDVQNPLVQANFPLFVFIKDKIVNNRLHGDGGYQFTGYQSPDGQVPLQKEKSL